MDTKQYVNTMNIVATMLRENTGMDMLDSGMDNNRKWQQLAEVDFAQTPRATLDSDGYTKSFFWHLVDTIDGIYSEVDGDWLDYLAYAKEINKYVDWYDVWQDWIEARGYKITLTENSYNGNSTTDGGCQVYEIRIDRHERVTAISTHNGCDIRGGYATPRIITNTWEDVLCGMSDGTIKCTSCTWSATTEDNYHWYVDGYVNNTTTLDELYDTDSKMHHCPTCQSQLEAV